MFPLLAYSGQVKKLEIHLPRGQVKYHLSPLNYYLPKVREYNALSSSSNRTDGVHNNLKIITKCVRLLVLQCLQLSSNYWI